MNFVTLLLGATLYRDKKHPLFMILAFFFLTNSPFDLSNLYTLFFGTSLATNPLPPRHGGGHSRQYRNTRGHC